MSFTTLDYIALIFRFGLLFVYAFMILFFTKNYRKSVEAGVPNKFFVGFKYVFILMILMTLALTSFAIMRNYYPEIKVIEAMFPGYEDPAKLAKVGIFANMTRPLYVFAFIMVTLVIAGQVYPLEVIMNWQKRPVTRFMLLAASLIVLIYIPFLTYTILTQIIFIIFYIAIAFGFFLDIGINIWLWTKSTGQLRTQFFFITIAFFFFYGGFAMSLELGWMETVWSGFDSLRYDIIFGVVLQILASMLYLKGFKRED